MPTEQEWRDKYRDVLSRLAAEEARWSKTQNVLKLLIGRLCLAAQGRDDRLDHEIARVADVARKQIDVDALDLLIAPLSAAVAALDSAESANGSSGARRGPRAEQIAPTPKNETTGSVPVARGAAKEGAGTAAETGEQNAGVSILTGAPVPATEEAFGATAVLDRLALLPELKPIVGELRSRKNDHLGIHELADLLERVTRFATEQRAQVQKEKLELLHDVLQLEFLFLDLRALLRGEARDALEQIRQFVNPEVIVLPAAQFPDNRLQLRQQCQPVEHRGGTERFLGCRYHGAGQR